MHERQILAEGFSQGFKLGYSGPRCPRESECLRSALNNVEATWNKLNKEISLGRIAGPFDLPPLSTLQCSPIGLIPKQQPGEWRLITHLSYPPGRSINDGIPHEICSVNYLKFDKAVEMVQRLGKGALIAKSDLKSAFRLLPVYPGDFDLLGFKFQNKYFVDKCLPMGASISCYLFECFSTFLEFRLKQITKSDDICHYLDDYLFAGKANSTDCHDLLQSFQNMCHEGGVPYALEKTEGPGTSLKFLGLELDTELQLVRVPQDKVVALCGMLQKAKAADSLTVKEIKSLLGSLNFVCRAVRPGRAFMRRLIDLTSGQCNNQSYVRIGVGAKKDIDMWLQFLEEFNGASMFPELHWVTNASLQLFTDAARSVGFGCYFHGHWTQGHWPEGVDIETLSIAWLELFPIVIALELWAHLMKNKRVKFWSDNQAVVAILNKQSTKCPHIMKLVRRLVLVALKNNISFKSCYIQGSDNGISDSLSRFQMERFRQLAPQADADMTPLPPQLL